MTRDELIEKMSAAYNKSLEDNSMPVKPAMSAALAVVTEWLEGEASFHNIRAEENPATPMFARMRETAIRRLITTLKGETK